MIAKALSAPACLVLAQAGGGALNDWVLARFAASSNVLWTALLLIVGGLLASLLPCVYPLYPITATVVRARARSGPVWLHPLAYYSGLCLTYAGLGAVAAVTGGAVNTILRYGITNLAIAALLAILTLSTVGLLHLPIFQPREVQNRGGLLGTALLGASAGLLSSACVGPVVASVLVNVAIAHGADPSWYALGRGGLQMLAFGMGVGLPFLAIGLLGMRLPRSGNWLMAVQYGLGALVLWFAYLYLSKALEIFGLSQDAAMAIAVALVVLFVSAFFFQTGVEEVQTRTMRALAVVGVVVGSTIFFLQLQPIGRGPIASPARAGTDQPAVEVDGELTWYLNDEDAYRQARESGRVVFMDFYGSWCTNCKEFSRLTKEDKALHSALRQAVLLKVYDSSPVFQKFVKDSRFPELKVGLPFFVVTDPEGSLVYKTNDYLKTDEMILFLKP